MINTIIKPDWPVDERICAFTTTRIGGVSLAPYDSFNLATHVGDDPVAVEQNRQRLTSMLHLPSAPVWLEQTHSTRVVTLPQADVSDCQADAAYSCLPEHICTVMTADCLPVLFYAPNSGEVAAAHAGWRGLCQGILENTLACFQEKPQAIMAWLGPAIGPGSFEVGAEVRQQFMQHDPEAAQAFRPLGENKYLADLYQLARQRLHHKGLRQIYGGHYCTMKDAHHFYSYRRQAQTGRMASLIWLANI